MRSICMVAVILAALGGVVLADGEKYQQEFRLSPSGRAIRVGASGLWLEGAIVNEVGGEFLLATNFREATVEVAQGLEPEEIRVWVPRDKDWRPKMFVHLFPKMTLRVHCEDEARQLREGVETLRIAEDGFLRAYPKHSDADREKVAPEMYGEEYAISNSPSVLMFNEATGELYVDAFVQPGEIDSPATSVRQQVIVRVSGIVVRSNGGTSERVMLRLSPITTFDNCGNAQRRASRVMILLHCEREVERWESAIDHLVHGGGTPDSFRSNIRTLNMRMLLGWCQPGDEK